MGGNNYARQKSLRYSAATKKEYVEKFNLSSYFGERIKLIEPAGYLDFLKLEADAALVLTDSGGVQEETTMLGIPCLTLRRNTERPITVSEGTNQLVGPYPERIVAAAESILSGNIKQGQIPKYWDVRAAERIVEIFMKIKEEIQDSHKPGTAKIKIADAQHAASK